MPARYNRVKKALRKMGVTVRGRKGKGSHVIVHDDSGNTYTLPCHHGEKTLLADPYLRALCRAFSLDFTEFKKNL
jgi:predicted RNA binding protein YcfA (HicA-like mRNA interferase family)